MFILSPLNALAVIPGPYPVMVFINGTGYVLYCPGLLAKLVDTLSGIVFIRDCTLAYFMLVTLGFPLCEPGAPCFPKPNLSSKLFFL